MTGPVPMQSVVDLCLDGVNKAALSYDELSGGMSLYEAPEWLIQSHVATSLGAECHYITLESGLRWLVDSAEGEKRGRLPRGRSGRVDITIWSAGDYPRFLIEVKKARTAYDIDDDVRRLNQLVERGGSFHRGLVVVYTAATYASTIDRRLTKLAEQNGAYLFKKTEPSPIDTSDEDSALWSAAVYSVKRAA